MNRYLDLKKIDHISKPALVNESWLTKGKIREFFNQTSFNILTTIKMDFTNLFDDWLSVEQSTPAPRLLPKLQHDHPFELGAGIGFLQ